MSGRAAVAVLLALVSVACHRPGPGTRVLFLSVGQGDCTVLATGQEALIVDTGPSIATAERTILRRLREEGITRVRAILLTHDDTDHVAGTPAIYAAFPDVIVWTGPGSSIPLSGPLRRLEATQRITFGPYRLDVRYPYSLEKDNNSRSSLIGVTVEGSRLALTGDSPWPIEDGVADLLPDRTLAGVGIYKAGHHGSAKSASARLLRQLRPRWVIVSCGVGNRYGHPHPSVLRRIAAAGAEVVRTDQHGDIVAEPRNGTWTVGARVGLRTR